MTTRSEAERLLSLQHDDQMVEIDADGRIYDLGQAPDVRGAKPTTIRDQKGEYGARRVSP